MPIFSNGINGIYEKRRWYRLVLPIMWLLTLWVMAKKALVERFGGQVSVNSFWFDGLGTTMRAVKEGAASWRALDIIYNRRLVNTNGRLVGRMFDRFWLGILNAQAVRNRLILVRQELTKAVDSFAGQGEVRILSLAAGSAQAVIEVLAACKERGQIVRALLVDIDQSALDYASSLAERLGVRGHIQLRRDNVAKVRRLAVDWRPQIIEMIGLLDYLPDDKAVKLLSQISQSLVPGGVLLTGNINPNSERPFLKWVINWPMWYRSHDQLAAIIAAAGFGDRRIFYEPHGIHAVAVAKVIGANPG